MNAISAKLTILSVILLMGVLVQGCKGSKQSQTNSPQEGKPQTFADAQTAATQALATFRKLVTKDNFKELGFDSPDQVANASLGAPMHIFAVKLDALREYQSGSDPNKLLNEAAQLYYPVIVGGQTRASVFVEQTEGKWKAASFGNAGLAKQIVEVSRGTAGAAQTVSSSDVIVQIPAFGLYFLGHRNPDNKLTLTALATDVTYNLRAGATEPAEEVFARLVSAAKSYNGLPM